MFIGHFALGFGARRLAPSVPLWMLFLACQLADLVWPALVLLGIEHFTIVPGRTAVTPLDFTHYPYSHSLLALGFWGAGLAAADALLRERRLRAMLVIAALVLSHWVLDVLAHAPDMPLAPGGATRLGLGLWSSVPATLLVEGALFAVGVAMYARATRALDRAGTVGLWLLVAFLALIYLANVFGPPPPSVEAVAWSAHAMWLLVLWAWWLERHRVVRAGPG